MVSVKFEDGVVGYGLSRLKALGSSLLLILGSNIKGQKNEQVPIEKVKDR